MNKRVLLTIGLLITIAAIAVAAIFYARGFKIEKRGIARTGLLVIDSTPDAASVYLDDRLTSATDTTISFLTPKKYHLKLTKEGYTIWEKDIEIRADLTTEVKAVLFPAIPELKPLTLSGADRPLLSSDGQKILFAISEGEKRGLWILDMIDRPFSFGKQARQIVKDTQDLVFSKAQLTWSPDSKLIWVKLQQGGKAGEKFSRNYLLDEGGLNSNLTDVTATLSSTLESWQAQINLEENVRIKRIPQELAKLASESATFVEPKTASITASLGKINYTPANIIWSPDETKLLILKDTKAANKFAAGATVTKIKDKNPLKKTPIDFDIPQAETIFWYPDSDHLVLVEKDRISIIESDGTNKVIVYSGSFEDNYVFPWPDGSKLVILTSFNQAAGTPPDLYTINLR